MENTESYKRSIFETFKKNKTMTVTNILKVLTKWVRKNKGVKEAFLFFVYYVQPIEQYFKNKGDIKFNISVSFIKSTCRLFIMYCKVGSYCLKLGSYCLKRGLKKQIVGNTKLKS